MIRSLSGWCGGAIGAARAFVSRQVGRPSIRVAAVAGLAASFLSFLVLGDRELRRERNEYNYLLTTNNWAVAQLVFELERFLGTLDRFMLGETGKVDLTLRFEVLWSRLPIMLDSEETAEARGIGDTVTMLRGVFDTLAAVEREVALLQPGDRERYRRIREALSAWYPEIHELTMEVFIGGHFQAHIERTRMGYLRAELYQWAMLAVVAILAVLLGTEVVRSARRARDEAAARHAAEAANLAKSAFLATMGHELRTPLNAIMGFSEIQERQIFGPLASRYREYAGHIHTSAAHLLGVVDAILDMARMENHRIALDEETFDPREALAAAIRMIDAERIRAGLALTVEAPPQALSLRADQRMFRQTVLNLLSNAVKFTPAGGRIRVALSTDDGGLTLAVQDSGTGIPPEALSRVTEAFFQADQSIARRHQGTGLGLSLVKGFAEMHGGSVSVDSSLGHGTTVVVRFPPARLQSAGVGRPGLRRA